MRSTSTMKLAQQKLFLITVWFGLLAGLLEGTALVLRRLPPGEPVRVSLDILWVAPLFYLGMFLLMGVGIGLLFLLIRRPVDLRLPFGLFVFTLVFGALLFFGKIEQWAAILLSAGAGVEAARRYNSGERTLNWFRKSLTPLAIVTLVLGLAGAAWTPLQERQAVSRLPQAKSGIPNLVLITLDTARADHFSSYGYSRETTPNIDSLASQGVLFENAFSNSSWTLPAHASLFTGRLPYETGADWLSPMSEDNLTLAEALAAAGYRTAGFAANTSYVSPEWGLGQGFSHFEVYGNLADLMTRTIYGKKSSLTLLPRLGYFEIPGRKSAETINGEFLSWLDRSGSRPFFAFLNYLDAHDPYLPPEPYRTQFSTDVSRGDVINFQFQVPFRRKAEVSPAEIQQEINSYDGALSYLDAQVGALMNELAARGLQENTLVVITSDHGEAFGNHDLFGHGNSLYLESLHVPLIFYWPGKVPAGQRPATVVGLNHLPATLVDLLQAGSASEFPGHSLAQVWKQPDQGSESFSPVVAELSAGRFDHSGIDYPNATESLKTLIGDEWQLILNESGQAELYAWRVDPEAKNNLAGTREGQKIVEAMSARLRSTVLSTDPVLVGKQ